jgi:hypothetical protein
VDRFLDVHVLEVVGDEEREVVVQAQRQRHALAVAGRLQRTRLVAQHGDLH